MSPWIKSLIAPLLALLVITSSPAILLADDDLAAREEAAIKAAVQRIAPCVVRIETLGGLETVENVLIGGGPTTGLIVSADGYIITSAFNFVQKPTQIIVDLSDGTRLPAQVVAHDNNRMLVLLKVALEGKKADQQLPVPVAAPVSEMRVGQWAIAVGRIYETEQPNISVGIVSATNRVWGKAIQTDAKISPANYGGPLVDLQGRVIGVLVPMSPMESGELAGVEWYDSGIGFAVPLEHIDRVLDRLKHGEDLQPGLMGITLKASDPYAGEVTIATCHPKSPARLAGLKPGDKIVEIDGVKISNQSDLKHQLAPRYAGEKIALALLRDDKRMEESLELVAKLPPYIHPFLGILPRRDAPTDEKTKGVTVRYVYPDSPAAKAGIELGDRIVSIAGQPVASPQNLQERIAALEPLETVKLDIERAGKTQTLEAKLATLPEAVPEKLPPARESKSPADSSDRTVGKITIKVPEAPSDCVAYVPPNYNSRVPHGLVVWLHPAGGLKNETIDRWKPLCEAFDLILLAPKSADPAHWQRTEAEFVRKAIDDVLEKYNIDRSRIVVVGAEAGGGMAYLLAMEDRDLIRGVAALSAPMPQGLKLPANDPIQRLAVFATSAKSSPSPIEAVIKKFRDAKYPVTQLELGENQRPLTDDELKTLARWIDTLDRS